MEPADEEWLERELMLHDSPVVRYTLVTIGTISIVLGIIGILLPIMPTAPFVLLAAACYARSSRKFYRWVMTNPHFGQYVRDWRAGLGIPLRAKIVSTLMIAVSFGTSIVFFVPYDWVKVVMIAIALSVMLYLWQLPTRA